MVESEQRMRNVIIRIAASYIHVCGRRNPNLNKCVEESVRSLIPQLKSGIAELSVPSLEPLNVDEIPLANLPEFRAVATDVKLSELSNFDVKYLMVDLKNQKIDLEIVFPRVTLDADYDVKAKILVPINEKGPISVLTGMYFPLDVQKLPSAFSQMTFNDSRLRLVNISLIIQIISYTVFQMSMGKSVIAAVVVWTINFSKVTSFLLLWRALRLVKIFSDKKFITPINDLTSF